MKLKEKTNKQICDENNLPYNLLTNVVEEQATKNKMRAIFDLIAKTLIGTLGPYGTSTIIQDREKRHFATKDGYDLMNRLSFEDEVGRTILDLLRTTASSQVLSVGDGSTSAIIVANALYQTLTSEEQREEFKRIAPKDIVDILNDLSEMLESEITKMAKPISKDMHELDTIAAVANNNDKAAGKLIADIYKEIGEYGFISMDVLDKQEKDTYEIKSGIEWDRGWVDPVFSKFAQDGKVCYDELTRVIISNSTLTYDDLELVLMPLIKNALRQEDAKLLIVANDYDSDVINFLKANRTKHLQIGVKTHEMMFTAVDIDQVTKESRNRLEDLALLCNCQIYDKMLTPKAEIVAHPEKFIGTAQKVVITAKSTQVVAAENMTKDHKKSLDQKIKEFTDRLSKLMQIEQPTKDEDLEIYELRRRVANLTASTAILHVGGKTLAERMTRQRLIEDAVFACKSAIKYGFIPGGNLCAPKILLDKKQAFADILGTKYNYLPIENIRVFFTYFIDMVANAFLQSFWNVLSNSYMTEEMIRETIATCLSENKFYNLKLHKFEDWNKTEVINSAYTDIQIIRSCMSIIGILATSNQVLTLNLNVMDNIQKDK